MLHFTGDTAFGLFTILCTEYYAILPAQSEQPSETTCDFSDVSVAGSFSPSIGEQPTSVLLANFVDDRSEPADYAYVYQRVFDHTHFGSVNSYVTEVSYGRAWLVGDVYPSDGWYNLPYHKAQACTASYWELMSVLLAMADPVVDFVDHMRVVVIFPNHVGCSSSAGRMLGVPTNEGVFDLAVANISGFTGLNSGTTIHEYLHLMGLSHANGWECGDRTIGGSCQSISYRDPFDVMGHSAEKAHLNLLHKAQLNWLTGIEIIDINRETVGLFRIGKLEELGELPVGIRISLSDGLHYTIEFRRPVGFDAIIGQRHGPSVYDGLVLHYSFVLSSGLGDSQLLDNTPHSMKNHIADFSRSNLGLWKSFKDDKNNIQITPVSSTDDHIDVCIGRVNHCGVNSPLLALDGRRKNRVLSFRPGNSVRRVGFLIQRMQMEGTNDFLGVLAPQRFPEWQVLGNRGRNSSASMRASFNGATLSLSELHYRDWGDVDTLHVTGSEVLPGERYFIFTVPEGCESNDCFSEPLLVETAERGDVNDDGQVDQTDVDEIISKIKRHPRSLGKVQLKLAGDLIDFSKDVDIEDLDYVLAALDGAALLEGTDGVGKR